MVRAIETLTIIFFVSIIILFIIILTNPLDRYAHNRNALRRQHLQTIMNDIAAHIDPMTMLIPAGIGLEPYQLGSSIDNCAMTGPFCNVTASGCLNLQALTSTPEYSIPSDIQTGSIYRTGYMVTMQDPETIKLVACHAENNEEIIETRTFKGLKMYAEPIETTN